MQLGVGTMHWQSGGGGGGSNLWPQGWMLHQQGNDRQQLHPLVDVSCRMQPPPKSHWIAPTQRHGPSKRSGKEGCCALACGIRTATTHRPSKGGSGAWGVTLQIIHQTVTITEVTTAIEVAT